MGSGDDQGDLPADDSTINAIDRWFIDRGVPHFIETDTEGSALDTWSRALPLLVVAYLLLCLNALDLRNWTLGENLAAAAAVLVIAMATWAITNRLSGKPTFARPTDVDNPQLTAFVLGPAVPSLLFGQPGDALESVILAIVFVTLIYVWSAYGAGPMLVWGWRESGNQLSDLGTLLAKALPLLLGFNMFLFITAETWELAGRLTGLAYVLVIGLFFVLATGFAISRVPRFVRELNDFESWNEVDALVVDTPAEGIELPTEGSPHEAMTVRGRLNAGLMVLFGQTIQVTFVVLGLIAFFTVFGFLAMPEETMLSWTRLDELHIFATFTLDGRDLIISESLLRVATFLGAFSGMYFTVTLWTDATYQEEITNDVGPQIRQALAVRAAYRVERGSHSTQQ
ncbi:MAG: hypothetical protein ACR2O6_03125 [Ilumatobacteraceae bacterium]